MGRMISVLDGIKVEDKAFPLSRPQSGVVLSIVSMCSHCGAPIYGPQYLYSNGPDPEIKYSCNCKQDKGSSGLNMQTK